VQFIRGHIGRIESLLDQLILLVLKGSCGLDLTLNSKEEWPSIGREMRHTFRVEVHPINLCVVLNDKRSHPHTTIISRHLYTIHSHVSDERDGVEDILDLSRGEEQNEIKKREREREREIERDRERDRER
jgi:hypothetical protein